MRVSIVCEYKFICKIISINFDIMQILKKLYGISTKRRKEDRETSSKVQMETQNYDLGDHERMHMLRNNKFQFPTSTS